jgi:hypothetical protein
MESNFYILISKCLSIINLVTAHTIMFLWGVLSTTPRHRPTVYRVVTGLLEGRLQTLEEFVATGFRARAVSLYPMSNPHAVQGGLPVVHADPTVVIRLFKAATEIIKK